MSDSQKELRLRVSETELAQIKENAQTLRMQVNPFVRYIGTEYAIIIEDKSLFDKHRNTLYMIDHYLSYLIDTFTVRNIYYAKEISHLYELRKELFYLLRHLYKIMIYHRTKSYRKSQNNVKHQIEIIDASKTPRTDKQAVKRPHSIRIKANPAKYEKIQKLAALHRLPIGVYLRYISLHPNFVYVSYPVFEPYTDKAKACMNTIAEIAYNIRLKGNYEWYEMTLILKAMVDIVENEYNLINEVAYRRPKLMSLREKYPKIMESFENNLWMFQNIQLGGHPLDDKPIEEDPIDDWMDYKLPHCEIDEEWLQLIELDEFQDEANAELTGEELTTPDTREVSVEDIITNAAKRSKGLR